MSPRDAGDDPQRLGGAMLDDRTLDDIVRRIVAVARPERIILFGSAARGEMGPHSDVDLLIVKEGAHRRNLAGRIYENLYGVGAAVDVVVVSPADVERYRNSPALVIKPALDEGRVVYESAPETVQTIGSTSDVKYRMGRGSFGQGRED